MRNENGWWGDWKVNGGNRKVNEDNYQWNIICTALGNLDGPIFTTFTKTHDSFSSTGGVVIGRRNNKMWGSAGRRTDPVSQLSRSKTCKSYLAGGSCSESIPGSAGLQFPSIQLPSSGGFWAPVLLNLWVTWHAYRKPEENSYTGGKMRSLRGDWRTTLERKRVPFANNSNLGFEWAHTCIHIYHRSTCPNSRYSCRTFCA